MKRERVAVKEISGGIDRSRSPQIGRVGFCTVMSPPNLEIFGEICLILATF